MVSRCHKYCFYTVGARNPNEVKRLGADQLHFLGWFPGGVVSRGAAPIKPSSRRPEVAACIAVGTPAGSPTEM